MGEEGKLEQLAALSRTHQGEIERGRKKTRACTTEAVEEDEEDGKNGEMDKEMREKGMEKWRRIQFAMITQHKVTCFFFAPSLSLPPSVSLPLSSPCLSTLPWPEPC